jgi:hypothetical protein
MEHVAEQTAASSLVSAIADLRMGTLIGGGEGSQAVERLESFASTVPELFATNRVSWEMVFQRLKRADELDGLQDLVMVSRRQVHVAIRSTRDPSIVLLAVAPRNRSIGLIVSEARARLVRLESSYQR